MYKIFINRLFVNLLFWKFLPSYPVSPGAPSCPGTPAGPIAPKAPLIPAQLHGSLLHS